MPAGLHIVAKKRRGKSVVWYVYAGRGGPQILRTEGARPKITAALTDMAAEVRRAERTESTKHTIAGLITDFRSSTTPEWARLATSTKASWSTWFERLIEEFGTTALSTFEDRRIRGDILAWRDRWADKPRSADMAMQALSRLLSWAVDRGRLNTNHAAGISQLYDSDRSEVIWETADFEAFFAKAAVEVREGVELAACTGLRRGDLVKLPWSAIGEHAIVWRTAKSRGKNVATIPLLPETRELLARIKARHAETMAARVPSKRRPLTETVLMSSYWRPWTPMGFGSRFNDAKRDSGIDKHLHDLRGTFVTRCCLAGLTDQEIASIVGWNTKDIAAIRSRYADQARVVIELGKRLAKGGA